MQAADLVHLYLCTPVPTKIACRPGWHSKEMMLLSKAPWKDSCRWLG